MINSPGTPTFTGRVLDEYRGMSRTMRLVAVVGVILAVVLVWSSLVDPIASAWGRSADEIEQQIDRIDAATAQAAAQRTAVIAFGPVVSPAQRATESQAMLEAVTNIMQESSIRTYELTEASSAVKVGAATLPGIDRIKATLKFEVDFETAFEVLGALERSPALEAITSVRIQRGRTGQKRLDIEVTLEAWIRGGTKR